MDACTRIKHGIEGVLGQDLSQVGFPVFRFDGECTVQ